MAQRICKMNEQRGDEEEVEFRNKCQMTWLLCHPFWALVVSTYEETPWIKGFIRFLSGLTKFYTASWCFK